MFTSSRSFRVLVTSTTLDALNHNHFIRGYLARGFEQCLGHSYVRTCPLELVGMATSDFQPDFIVAVGSLAVDEADLRNLTTETRRVGAKLAYWLHDDPYEFDFGFKAELAADHVFTNDRWALSHYRHPSVSHLPMAACPDTHFRPIRPLADRDVDLFFCGVAFDNRIDLLSRAQASLAARTVEVVGAEWPPSFRFATNRRLLAAEMADRASRARLTLNIGRTFDIANQRFRLPPSTPGPRTFEIALAGSAQLFFVNGLEICDYFVEGHEILLFDDVSEIEDMIARSYREPDAIDAIARAAQARALDAHTYKHRAETMLDTMFG